MSNEPEDDVEVCETCGGEGEVGPTGWEYPEWHTCPDCRGTGVFVEDDPDRKHDERIDWEF